MTPEDEADLKELILRLQAAQEIDNARLLVLGKVVDDFGHAAGVQIQGGLSTSEFVKKEVVRYLTEKMRHYADHDPTLASWVKRLLDEYGKS
jgi:predicted AlkP superfamily pyrophosphatase or phosphodiesterase